GPRVRSAGRRTRLPQPAEFPVCPSPRSGAFRELLHLWVVMSDDLLVRLLARDAHPAPPEIQDAPREALESAHEPSTGAGVSTSTTLSGRSPLQGSDAGGACSVKDVDRAPVRASDASAPHLAP